MRNIELAPSRLIKTNDMDERTVVHHMSLLARGFTKAVHRVIVAKIHPREWKEKEIWSSHEREIRQWENKHIIVDGNNRAFAGALVNNNVPAIRIASDEDVTACREMAERGEIGHFVHDHDRYEDLVEEAIRAAGVCSEDKRSQLDVYVKEMVEKAGIEIDKLPAYIRDAIRFPLE